MLPTAVAVITEENQNDVVAALHATGVGHLTRVIRRERGAIADQLARAGVEPDTVPETILEADRIVLVSPAVATLDLACLMLQRGAVSAWTMTTEFGWQAVDDKAIEIAATRELPARPVPPVHRSERTFRKAHIRRKPRRNVVTPSAGVDTGDSAPS